MDPDLSFAYNMRGSLYFQKQMYNEALDDFGRAIELTPRSVFYKNRAAVYYALGKKREADEDERRAAGLPIAAAPTATPHRNMARSKAEPAPATPLPEGSTRRHPR